MKKKKKLATKPLPVEIVAEPREIIAAQRLSVNTVKETSGGKYGGQTTATVLTIDI